MDTNEINATLDALSAETRRAQENCLKGNGIECQQNNQTMGSLLRGFRFSDGWGRGTCCFTGVRDVYVHRDGITSRKAKTREETLGCESGSKVGDIWH